MFWSFSDLSSSPPGPYLQDPYVIKPEDKIKSPPILPPHLLQVLLNKDTGVSVSTHFIWWWPTCSLSLCYDNKQLSEINPVSLDPHQCDPTLLPEPNHVMLSHLYALSIKVTHPPLQTFILLFRPCYLLTESSLSKLIHIFIFELTEKSLSEIKNPFNKNVPVKFSGTF